MGLGRDVLLEVLRTEGVGHVFGNPGSTELPLIDALAEADDLRYVLGLQEATVVGMADGYAQATGRPAFRQPPHVGRARQRHRQPHQRQKANRTPLVVTAGQQDYRHIVTDPLLSGPLVVELAAAGEVGHEVRTAGELGTVLRRAFHDAAAPPAGPVFVSLPMDCSTRTDRPGAAGVDDRARPCGGGLEELADLLTEPASGRVGDRRWATRSPRPGRVPARSRWRRRSARRLRGAAPHGRGVFPPTHPLWKGMLAPAAAAMRQVLGAYDRVLLIAEQAVHGVPLHPGSGGARQRSSCCTSPRPGQLGRAYPAAWASPATLRPPSTRCSARRGPRRCGGGRRPRRGGRARPGGGRALEATALAGTARPRWTRWPRCPRLVRAMPPSRFVVDEAITTGCTCAASTTGPSPVATSPRGGGLGWGMPAASACRSLPVRAPVLCVVGDGSAMYSPQALWTAAAEGLPVVFAVVNNRQYKILKGYLRGMGGRPRAAPGGSSAWTSTTRRSTS